jgi:hypothetical protein
VRHPFEADVASQIAELVAADDELARLSVDVAEARLSRDDTVEPSRLYRRADVSSFTS